MENVENNKKSIVSAINKIDVALAEATDCLFALSYDKFEAFERAANEAKKDLYQTLKALI